MPKEVSNPRPPRNYELFGLTENEDLFFSVSDRRFSQLVRDEQTQIHHIEIAENTFGEFLFVTLSREANGKRIYITFWGLGFHDQREQWITDSWRWHETTPMSTQEANTSSSKTEAEQQIEARRDEVSGQVDDTAPSQRAILFSMLADLTDEDGALTEIEDLENAGLLRWLFEKDDTE